MADEPIEQTAGETGDDGEPVDGKKKGSMGTLLILLPVLLIGLAGGGWIAFSYYPELARAAEILHPTAPEEEDSGTPEPIEYGQFKELQGLIINPTNSDGRFLMLNIGLETAEPAVLEELDQKDIVVKDTILRLMSERTVQELGDITRRDTLKQVLIDALNGILNNGKIDRIYFTQYVIQ